MAIPPTGRPDTGYPYDPSDAGHRSFTPLTSLQAKFTKSKELRTAIIHELPEDEARVVSIFEEKMEALENLIVRSG